MRLLIKLICASLLTLSAATAAGQASGSVSIDLDRNIGRVGERMKVTVQVKVTGAAGSSQFIRPAFAGFRVMGTHRTNHSAHFGFGFPGQSSQQISASFIYTVEPTRAGMLNVGPAAVKVDGRLFKSAVVKLKVLDGGAPAPPPPPERVAPVPPERAKQPLFITASATPKKVYLGQQVVASWYLYTRVRLFSPRMAGQPTTDDFWSEDLTTPNQLEFKEKMISGTAYGRAVLAQKALFPQKSGTLTISPLKFNVRTLEEVRNPSANTTRESPPIVIEVMPLPEQGKPPGFTLGNVGSYVMAANLDRDSVKAGDAVTLRLDVRGQGNLRQLKLPKLDKLQGFKVYEPKTSERFNREQDLIGEKTVEYLLMPLTAGRLRIPPIVLDTFDPRTGRYKRLQTSPLMLQVKGSIPKTPAARQPGKTNVLDRTIRPPRPAKPLTRQQPVKPLDSTLFWLFVALPVCLLVLVTGGENLRARLTRETPGRLRRAVSRRIARNLGRARDLRQQGDKASFFGAISAALRDLLDHKLGELTEGMTRGELAGRLEAAGFSPEQVAAVTEELENCDFARFAPSASGEAQMDETLARVKQLLNQLSRVRSKRGV